VFLSSDELSPKTWGIQTRSNVAKLEPKKKRAAAADIFDDWFDQEPEKAADDEWDF